MEKLIKLNNTLLLIVFLLARSSFAGAVRPYNPAVDSTAVFKVCAAIGAILSQPLVAFQIFLKGNSYAVTMMYTVSMTGSSGSHYSSSTIDKGLGTHNKGNSISRG